MSILWHSKRMQDWWMTEDEKDWKNISLMEVIVSFYTMSFNVYWVQEWVFQYRNTWNEVESQVFEKLITEPTKGESEYRHGNLKLWTKYIRKVFHGQDAPCDVY